MGISPFASNAAKLHADGKVDTAKGILIGAESWYIAWRISIGSLRHFAYEKSARQKVRGNIYGHPLGPILCFV